MVAYLTKSDVSEGFNQIIDFLNGSSIKYDLTVNPNIYVLYIKQFWTTVAVKKVNDVIRLQALVNKKKVVVTEATIREELRLDDAEGVDCLTNEEFFAELARMGYEKPSTKLTFYKDFFSSQWKFLIHIILQCMSAKRTSWNEYSSSMASVVICLSSGDLSTHTTKYTSPALTQKVFANIQRVDENVEEVNVGDAAEGDDSAAHGEVPTVAEEPSIPSHTPSTLPPNHLKISLQLPRYNQHHHKSPQVQLPSPQPQPQPQQDAEFPMNLLQKVMDTCATLTRRVEHLEFDKVAQAIKITKLKQRVKKLERWNKVKVLKLRRLQKDDREVADAVKDVKDAMVDESVDIQERQAESQAEIYKIDLDHANKVLSMQEDETKPTEVQEVVDVATTAKLISEVVTAASETITAANPTVKKYQALKRKPQTEAQARKNMMLYLKNVASFKMDYFKGMSYDDIRPIFEAKFNSDVDFLLKTKEKIKEDENRALQRLNETLIERAAKRRKLNKEIEPKPLKKKQQIEQDEQYARELHAELNKNIDWDKVIDHVKIKAKEDPTNVVGFKIDYFKGISYDDIHPIFEAKFNSNVDFLLKTKEQIEEDKNRALQRLNETLTERAAKRQKLNEEAPVVDYQIIELNNKPYYKIIRADDAHQLYIITFTTTPLILLVERKYPLIRFTLNQMLNAVRLAVEEESEVSLELLRFIRQQHQEGQLE
uniref:Xylulose kinase-1 n=1 Tax=Tanacetum cinerariifolium TaxID=118510 RepID=A0A6L2MDD8_TANCI|nr:hypothetical protein [Tanacetum cinerariifolium]